MVLLQNKNDKTQIREVTKEVAKAILDCEKRNGLNNWEVVKPKKQPKTEDTSE